MLPDNFDALNACFRDTVINILLVQWIKLLSDLVLRALNNDCPSPLRSAKTGPG